LKEIYGAIIGDVAGSIYEVKEINAIKLGGAGYEKRIKILNKQTPLFTNESSFTDDSILTCAIAKAILSDGNYEKYLRKFGENEKNLGEDKYGRSKFGKGFIGWLGGGNSNSSGNGSAMRISPVGFAFDTLDETLKQAELATICSHNNADAINSAKAVAGAVFLARKNKGKEDIKNFCKLYVGNIDFDLEDLRRNYKFTSKAMDSVPQAISCFLQSDGFEQTLRNSISIGGDSDTISCIACGIAGAYFGVPEYLVKKVVEFIPENYNVILNDFDNKFGLCRKSTDKEL
jgi:ADP-ribosylglycohydrolase